MKTLIVESDPEARDELRRAFQAAGQQVRTVSSVAEARRHLPEFLPDTVVAAGEASGDGIAFLLESLAADSRRTAFAVVDRDHLEEGVEATARGIHDFLWTPVSPARVAVLLSRSAARVAEEARVEELRVTLARKEITESLSGSSPRWKAALAAIEREASLESPVLLTGEAGTEKEAAARSLHRLSARGAEPLALVDAGELASADGARGALFFASVESLDLGMQDLLRDRIERRVGPRVIVSSDEDPQEAVAAGRLSATLFEALREHVVHLPPLRERTEDIALLAQRALSQIDPTLFFDAEALDALSTHDWPGNVEELVRVVRRASQLSDRTAIGPTTVLSVLAGASARRRARRRKPPVVRVPVGASLADVERRLIQKTLEFVRGNKPKAAELLKLSLKTIYNKIKEYGLEH